MCSGPGPSLSGHLAHEESLKKPGKATETPRATLPFCLVSCLVYEIVTSTKLRAQRLGTGGGSPPLGSPL